jgi:hypothetical protein
MEAAEILQQFEWLGDEFPHEAVAAAVERREEITPALLGILQQALDRRIPRGNEREYMAHLFAMYLLAQFRETRAYPLVVAIAMMSGDDLDEDFGDFVTTDLNSVLASVCGGDLDGIKAIIEREDADEWARGAALSSLPILVAAGIKTREEILDYFAVLYRGNLARTPKNETLWAELVCCTADLFPEELMQDIERAYDDGLVDTTVVLLEDVRDDLEKGKDQVLAKLSEDPNYRLIEDTADRFGSWACFHEIERLGDADDPDPWDDLEAEEDKEDEEFWDSPISDFEPSVFTETVRRTSPKIGRNDPCPCGSGKKYKKCCIGLAEGYSDFLSKSE